MWVIEGNEMVGPMKPRSSAPGTNRYYEGVWDLKVEGVIVILVLSILEIYKER